MERSTSLSQQAYDQIRQDIIVCRLRPGLRIVQSQLAEHYQVGITPIREALQRLAHEHLVRPSGRLGYLVLPVTRTDVCEIYELRIMLEAGAMRYACERATEPELRAIAAAAEFRYVHGDIGSYLDFQKRNTRFHLSIAALSRNQRLLESLSQLMHQSERLLLMGLSSRDRSTNATEEHRALAQALCDRDSERAERLVEEQLGASFQKALGEFELLDDSQA